MNRDNGNVADMSQAQDPLSAEFLMTTVVGPQLSERAVHLSGNAAATGEKSAAARHSSEWLKLLAATGF